MTRGSCLIRALCWTAAAIVWLQPAMAQSPRDPTIPPFGLGGSGGRGAGAEPASPRGLRAPLSVILVDGQYHLVVGTRLYTEGQKIGEARIERITETEVWLREGRELRKVSNYVGVKRRIATDTAEAPTPEHVMGENLTLFAAEFRKVRDGGELAKQFREQSQAIVAHGLIFRHHHYTIEKVIHGLSKAGNDFKSFLVFPCALLRLYFRSGIANCAIEFTLPLQFDIAFSRPLFGVGVRLVVRVSHWLIERGNWRGGAGLAVAHVPGR